MEKCDKSRSGDALRKKIWTVETVLTRTLHESWHLKPGPDPCAEPLGKALCSPIVSVHPAEKMGPSDKSKVSYCRPPRPESIAQILWLNLVNKVKVSI